MGGKPRQRKPLRMQGGKQIAELTSASSRSLISRLLISARL
jgi:hypothetical protein